MKKFYKKLYLQKQKRYLKKKYGTFEKPRLSLFRSNKHIYAQLINDLGGNTLLAFNTLKKEFPLDIKAAKTCKGAFISGQILAKYAFAKNIKKVVFDRQNYKYQGRIKSFIEGARTQGLIC